MKKSDENKISEFDHLFSKFKASMFAYIDMLPFIAGFGPAMSWMVRTEDLIRLLNNESTSKIDDDNRTIYELPISLYQKFKEIEGVTDSFSLIGNQVPKMLIIGIVSSYEYYSTLLIREIFKKNNGIIEGSEKTISVKDVFLSGNIDEFKEIIIDKEIEDVMRRGFPDQIKWFEKNLGINKPISGDYDIWNELVEIFERRNLFAHANGIIGKRYIDKISNLNLKDYNKIKKGKELFAHRKYFKNSLENITELRVKLIQVVWRKLYPSEADTADQAITNFAFELIEKGEYKLSAKIYLFAESMNKKKENKESRINIVNLSNCYALMGDKKKMEETLETLDWSAVSDDFLICIAAVRADVTKVTTLMNKLKHDDTWDELNYERWPVFFQIREIDEFSKKFEELYGRPLAFSPKHKSSLNSIRKTLTGGDDAAENSVEKEKIVGAPKRKSRIGPKLNLKRTLQ